MGRVSVRLTPGFAALLCLFCFADDRGLLLPFLLAAACHELGHLAALRASGVPVRALTLTARGAVLTAELAGRPGELWAVLAGPLVNLALALLCFRRWPEGFLCNAVLCVYNLIPVWPLDGGRLLYGLLPCRAARIVEVCVVLSLAGLGLWATLALRLGLLPCLLAGIFLLRLPNGIVNRHDFC